MRQQRVARWCLVAAMALTVAMVTPWRPASAEVSVAGPLNTFRASRGLAPLRPSHALALAARRQAEFLARTGSFTHRGPGGSTVDMRARASGYRACVAAENIAQGQRDAREAVRDWVASPSHRRNMAHRRLTHYGYATAHGGYHVLVLAAPC